ncbi:MAG: ATP-dependent RNA helicase HrpA [Immundisolibacteraceae bacterium]|nr:ATP-dependent RNA helicase HrpA [Immundisolibacteraceae bacterium]
MPEINQNDSQLQPLITQLNECMIGDRHRLLRRINRARHRDAVEPIKQAINRSIDAAQSRRAALPAVTLPEELPITGHADELITAIKAHQVVIVAGETGSGKSTQLPKLCLQAGRGVYGTIGHTQPRRVAARSIASRLSNELGTQPGEQVGYKVRFNDKTSPNSLIKLMTDGILLAETRNDPWLNQYDTLIIDEAHERSLNIDFLLGILKQLINKRPDLKLIITSATIDTDQFSRFFNNAPVFEVSGRGYPVAIDYQPLTSADPDQPALELNQGIHRAIRSLLTEGSGDTLVFLPGEREIVDAQRYLSDQFAEKLEILPLYSRLSQADQDRIFKQRKKRRVILSTNVAETSLTVPGIHYVIDSGLARMSRYSARSKIQRLPIENISQAAANQRAGRCGRIAPGICVRLFDEDNFDKRPAQTEPEIVRTNLATVILQMLNLRLGDPLEFPFVDPPQRRLIKDGYQTLHELGAVNQKDEITPTGRHLAQLPIDPRLGRMLLAASTGDSLQEMLIITAGLAVQDPRERPREFQQQADQKHRTDTHPQSDFLTLLNLWNRWQRQSRQLSNNQFRRWCWDNFLNFMRLREWQDVHRQLTDYARQQKWPLLAAKKPQPSKSDHEEETVPVDYDEIHRALLSGLLSNIARQTENKTYLGARSTQVTLFPGSALYKKPPKWIIAAELVETSQLFARTAAFIDRQWIEPLALALVRRTYSEPHWAASRSDVFAFEKVTLFGLPIVDRRRTRYSDIDPAESRQLFIRDGLVADDYQAKFSFLKQNRDLVAELEALEVRSRRHDLLVDDSVRYDFFDQRIPADVCNGFKFKTWWRHAGRDQPDLLCYTRDLLTQHQPIPAADQLYPERWSRNGIELPLDYRFEPIHPADGATLTVPIPLLNQVDSASCEYLIPGLLPEKITALLRQLPKPVRRQLVPLPDRAEEVLQEPPEPEESIIEYLRRRIRQLTQLDIPVGAMSNEALPTHLRLHLQLVDDKGALMDSSDDAITLQEKWQDEASEAFGEITQSFERRDITEWDFGDLPEWVEQSTGHQAIRAYPALVVKGAAAAIEIFDQPRTAQQAHRQGVCWLLARSLRQRRPGILPTRHDLKELALGNADLGPAQSLVNDVSQLILNKVYDLYPLPRSQQQFSALLEQPTEPLQATSDRWLKLLDDLTESRHRLGRALRKLPINLLDTGQQIQRQLGELIYEDFLTATPAYWLPHLPRYLEAMLTRLERADQNPAKERQLRALIAPLQQRWQDCPAAMTDHPDWIEYRWCLEELRVSLFAQPLKTHRSVSVEKMEKMARALPRE